MIESFNYIIAYNDRDTLIPWKFDLGEVQNADEENAEIDLYFVKQHEPDKDWKIYKIPV